MPEFIQEARNWGVFRSIKAGTLRPMAWGDRIYLASRDMGLRAPVIFGYFSLEGIKGVRLDEEARAGLKETGKGIEVASHDLSLLVQRGCVYCVEGGLYCVTGASVTQLLDYGQNRGLEARGFSGLPRPYPALRDLRPFRGFRGFDGQAFRRDLEGIGGEGMGKRFDPIGQLGRVLATMPTDKGGERSMRRGKEILEDLDKLGLLLAGEDRVKLRPWALFLEVFIDLRDELVRVESRLSEILGAMPPIKV